MIVPDGTRVAVLGRGRWAKKVLAMIASSGVHSVHLPAVRRGEVEDHEAYVARLAVELAASGCTHAWLCVPPGLHVLSLTEAAVGQGIGVIAEKPWPYSQDALDGATSAWAGELPPVVVCFEYVLLDAVRAWRGALSEGAGLTFHGTFCVAAPDRLGIPALWNMGSHLLAIREWAVPQAAVGSITASYDAEPARRAWLEDDAGSRVAEIDFLGSSEPILQRFLAGATSGRGPVSELDPAFAHRVARAVAEREPWVGRPTGGGQGTASS